MTSPSLVATAAATPGPVPDSVEPLLVASVDELRVLATLAGTVLPPVCDAGPGDEGNTAADVAAVRSLLARGWFSVDEVDGTAGATASVARALGALLAPEVVVEVEVRTDGDLHREALVLGADGDRWLRETLLGVWSLHVVAGDPVSHLDEVASGPAPAEEDEPGPERRPAGRVLDAEAELAAGGREVVLRRARRLGPDRFEADELHWLVGPQGRWVVEPAELDLDDDRAPEDVAVAVSRDELDEALGGFLADVAVTVAEVRS